MVALAWEPRAALGQGSPQSPGGWGDSHPWRPLSPSACGPWPAPPSPASPARPLGPKPAPAAPWPLTPVYKHSPGAGWGQPERGLQGRGGGGRAPHRGRHQQRGTRGWCAREPARQLERTERLVFETVNSLNPYCEGFMQNISGLLKWELVRPPQFEREREELGA